MSNEPFVINTEIGWIRECGQHPNTDERQPAKNTEHQEDQISPMIASEENKRKEEKVQKDH